VTLHVAFWHADGTLCAHGWPAGTSPPAIADPAGRRASQADGLPACADGRTLTRYSITQAVPCVPGVPGPPYPEPNPRRLGACPGCGNYRADGRHPYLHRDGCGDENDLQADRFMDEIRAGDPGGPVLYETDADAERAQAAGVTNVTTYARAGLG
jgi:hypothetical protein